MIISGQCIHCLTDSNWNRAKAFPREIGDRYMRLFAQTLAKSVEEGDSAPVVIANVRKLRREILGIDEDYSAEKRLFNALMLSEAPRLRARIDASADPLTEAMRISMAGNYIDYGAVKDVNPEKLMELLENTRQNELPEAEYEIFRRELQSARALTLITDNCGEIVLDRLLLETIKKLYPAIRLTAVVRGADVHNDATAADAAQVGLDTVAEIVDNGTDIGGTELSKIGKGARAAIAHADIIIAKGQGNFESLSGCGLNIYYLFLCKCALFTSRFQMERFRGAFVNERRLEGGA